MPGKKRNRGITWNPDLETTLQGVSLPPKIKCHRCEKNLPTVKFSEKQLNGFRAQIFQTNGDNMTSRIICRLCVGGPQQFVELECTVCGETKVLDDFAKSQRRVPDTARCYNCTDELVNQKPIDDRKYMDSKTITYSSELSSDSYPEYFSSATSAESSSIGDWATWDESMKNGKKTNSSLSSALENMSFHGSSTEADLLSSAGDNVGNGSHAHTKSWHTASLSPATSNTGSVRSYASSVAERSVSAGTSITSPIPARAMPMRPMGDNVFELNGADIDPWGNSDPEDEDEDYGEIDSDDSDGENTII